MRTLQKVKSAITSLIDSSIWHIAYLILGLLLAIPYTFLAGWDTAVLGIAMFALPIAALIFYTLWCARKVRAQDVPWWVGVVALMFLGWCLLPIFTNGISIGLRLICFVAASRVIFELRFWSLGLVPGIALTGFIAYALTIQARRQLSNGGTPPTNPSCKKSCPFSAARKNKRDSGFTLKLLATRLAR